MAADAEDLSWGFRSRLGVLVALILVALAAAVWSSMREVGKGEPEQRRRLMVVTAPDSNVNYHAVLERGGFEIEVHSLAEWEAEAREALDDQDASAVAVVVELADLRGFGYVVFEAPGSLSFDGLELEPGVDDIEDFSKRDVAVLSVGDLAFPHRLSVDAVGDDPVLRMPGYGALEALFDQPSLLAREQDDRPTVAELQHEDAIQTARWMHERPATFATAIEFARQSMEADLAVDADVHTLVGPFETGSAVPSPDGGLLIVHHGLDIFSDDAQNLRVEPAKQMRLDWLSVDAQAKLTTTGELSLEPCTSLAGGALELADEPHLEAAIDGSALVIADTRGPATVWRKLEGPGCTWSELARVSLAETSSIVLAPRFEPGQRSMLAEVGMLDDGEGWSLRLWLTPEQGGALIEEHGAEQAVAHGPASVELLRLSSGKIGSLAFIDDLHLAALTRVPLPPEEQTTRSWADHAIELLDRRRGGAHLRVPAQFFAEDRALRELAVVSAAVPGERGPSLALTTVDGVDTELIVLTIADGPWQRFEQAVVDPNAEAELHTLTPGDLEVRTLARGPAFAALTASPAGTRLAYAPADGARAAEIAVIDTAGGEPRTLTHNELVDTLPRLTADGRHVVFVTAVRSGISEVPFSVPRIAAAM